MKFRRALRLRRLFNGFRPGRIGLRSRIAGLCVLTAAPLLTLLIVDGILDRNRSIAAAERTLREAAIVASKDQNTSAVGAAGVLRLLGGVDSVRLMTPGACDQIVSLAADLDHRIDAIAVIRPSGAISCSSRADAPRPALGDRGYFKQALSARDADALVTAVVQSRISNRPALIVAVPIPGNTSSVMPNGVISASVDLGWLAQINARLPSAWRSTVLLIDLGAGAVIAQGSDSGVRLGADAQSPLLSALLTQVTTPALDGIIHAGGEDGRAMLFGIAPFRFGQSRLAIAVGAVRSGVLADVNARSELEIGIALAAVVLTVLLAWALAQIGLLNPIDALVGAADKFGSGDLQVRAPIENHVRELRTLGLAFNRMAHRLQARDREIIAVQAALAASEEHHRLLAENATDMITRFDQHFIRSYVSPACYDLLGFRPEELVGQAPGHIVYQDDWLMLDQALNLPLKAGAERAMATYRAIRKDGSMLWLESRGRRLPDGTGFVVVTRDVSERMEFGLRLEAANRQLEELATHDPLTGLANRRRFDVLLDAEYRRAWRMQLPMSLCFIDADHFKAYNDALGHPAGDLCLQALAKAIDGSLRRPADLAARVGGEEFMVLLPGTDAAGAERMGNLIREAVHDLDLPHPTATFGIVTVSIGIATLRPDGNNTVADLIDAADSALYRVKRTGRDGVLATTG